MHEPATTALSLAVLGLLMALSVVLSRLAGRASVPVAFLFLAIGVLAGQVGHIGFQNYETAFRLGTVGLVLILFDGGLNTSLHAVKRAIAPATALATFGVLITAGVVAFFAHLLQLPWSTALLLGAIVSSTDAAAVFSVLRGSRVELTKRVAATLELESGLNDPLAVILTLALTVSQNGHVHLGPWLALDVVRELAFGLAGGASVGYAGRWVLRRLRPTALGLLPVFTVALAFVAFGVTTLAHGSGFLAAYTAGILVGNGALPYRSGLLRVHDALAWLGQVVMFLVLGLLIFPTRLWAVSFLGIAVGLVLACVARPIAVLLCLLPFRYRPREIAYVGWVGLRGAVPIILATFPVLAEAPDALVLFDIVFFVVVVNTLIPGATVRWVTRLLGVEVKGPPPPSAVLEVTSTRPLHSDLMAFYIDQASAVAHARLSEIPFPSGAALMLIVRGEDLLPARGDSQLLPGDHVYLFCLPEDRPTIRLLFGRFDDDGDQH